MSRCPNGEAPNYEHARTYSYDEGSAMHCDNCKRAMSQPEATGAIRAVSDDAPRDRLKYDTRF